MFYLRHNGSFAQTGVWWQTDRAYDSQEGAGVTMLGVYESQSGSDPPGYECVLGTHKKTLAWPILDACAGMFWHTTVCTVNREQQQPNMMELICLVLY